MERVISLQLPIPPRIWALAIFKVSRLELRGLLGHPHFVETDPRRTCGGEQDSWAYQLPSGQRALVVLDVIAECAGLFGDPPKLEPLLKSMQISFADHRLARHAEPWPVEAL